MLRKNLLLLVAMLLFGIAFVQAQENTYVVKSGDTITSIAAQFNVSVDAILVRNGIISPNYLTVGETLIIPTGALTAPTTYTVQAGDNLTYIAQRFNTTVEALLATNGIPAGVAVTAGQVLKLPATGGAFTQQAYAQNYTVDIQDTLKSIAAKYGTTWEILASYNKIANANYIQAGSVIVIPPVGYVIPVVTTVPTNTGTGGAIVPTPVPTTVVVQPISTTYIVKTGDTLNGIAAIFGVTLQSINKANGITDVRAIQPGLVLTIPLYGTGGAVVTPPVSGNYYVVQSGDTMFAIASKLGKNVYSLAQANGILNLNAIYVGQRLLIP